MDVVYRNNTALGPGNGILTFSGILPPLEPWNIAIQRSSDQAYITADGQWLPEEKYITLPGRVDENGNVELNIGPAIVNTLDQLVLYRVKFRDVLRPDGKPETAKLKTGPIIRSLAGQMNNTVRMHVAPPPEPVEPEQPEPPVQPKPAVEPEKPVEELTMATDDGQQADRKKKMLRYGIIALLALLCIAWAVIDYMRKGPDNNTPLIAENTAAPRQEEQARPQTAQPQASTQALDAETRVREFFRGNPTPAAAAQLSRELSKTEAADQDAVYRLYYFAAEGNEPSILMEYAACLDPAMPQWGSIEKDAPHAAQIYRSAEAANLPGATESLQKMQAWLQNSAAAGDEKAKEWLAVISK